MIKNEIESLKEYVYSDTLVKAEANNLYEFYERDYYSFQSSKLRAIADCERKLRIVSDSSQRLLLELVINELKKNF